MIDTLKLKKYLNVADENPIPTTARELLSDRDGD